MDEGKSAANRPAPKTRVYGRSLATELAVLSWRTAVDIWRNWSLLAMHLGISVVMGVVCGAIFYQLRNNIAGAQGRLGKLIDELSWKGKPQ